VTKLEFLTNSRNTLGIELELGLVEVGSWELSNSVQDVLSAMPSHMADVVKPELMQSCLEINTGICETVGQARHDLREKLQAVEQVTDRLGLRLWWGATHPFSHWSKQQVTPTDRYQKLVNLLQEMARRLVTFGLHVHIGVDSGDKAVMICDRIMRHLPTLLALTGNSPFWESRDTGLASHRTKIMEGLPTAGLPTLMRNWSEYVWLVTHMVDTGFINTIREIWWDVRPHHNFGTVEVRVCDMPGNLEEALAVAALVQCLVKALSDEIDRGTYQHDCHPMMVRQNKWRACRYGNHAQLVDTYSFVVQSAPVVVESLVASLRSDADQLDCRRELEHCVQMAKHPGWAQRQRDIMNKSGDGREVVRCMTLESRVTRQDGSLPEHRVAPP